MTDRHTCPLPADWPPDGLWRCPDGHLWAVGTACNRCHWLGEGEAGMRHIHTVGHAWWPAPWWTRRLAWALHYRRTPVRRARLDMAGPNRVQGLPKGAPDDAASLPDYDG